MTSVEYQKEWRKNNPERWREIHRKSNAKHRHKYNAVERAWRANNKEVVKGYALKQQLDVYGLSVEDFNRLLAAQNGCCAICGRPQTTTKRRFAVDHDHQTTVVRGILCGNCNTALGGLQDSPELLRRAAAYIELNTAAQGVM